MLETLAQSLDLELLQLKYAICLLSCFPLAIIHRKLPNIKLKYAFALIMGLWISIFCFGWDTLHFVATSTVTYLMMWINRGRYPWLITLWNFLYLTVGHYDRWANHYLEYSINWTLPMMILTCKLGALGFNYYDGTHATAEELGKYNKARSINQLPSLLEFYSYVFCFVGFLTGPWSEFREYKEFTEGKWDPIPWPGSFLIRRLVMAAVAFVGFRLSNSTFTPVYVTTPAFLEHSFTYRLAYYWISCELAFSKYYLVWYLGEGAMALFGLSYNGCDERGNPKWDRILMVDVVRWKLARNPRELVKYWNMMVAQWLKYHIHERLMHVRVGQRRLGLRLTRLITFVISAFWHGFYPGYYFFFIGSVYFIEIGNLLRKKFYPLVVNEDGSLKYPHETIYHIAAVILNYTTLLYTVMAFHLMSFDRAVAGYASIYFSFHVVGALIAIYLKFVDPLLFGPPKPIPREKKTLNQTNETTKTK